MSLFSWLKRNKESYSLVFNIGSGSVAGGIIRFTEKEGVNMSYYAKELFPFQQEISPEKHLELMKSSLTTLTGKIHTDGLKKINSLKRENVVIDRVFYIFSSPWSISQTKTIRIKEPKVFKVTESYLNKVVEEQEKQFQTDISKHGKIIEKKIIQVKINGYVINNIYNKLAKDLELSVLLTVVPEEILQTINEIVVKTFNIKNIWCHSLTLALFSNIRNLFPQKEDFIQIDVSEEITDISIVKDSIIVSSASIPFGRNHFVRELASISKVSEEIADSMVKMCCSKNNNEAAALKLAVTMDSAGRTWLANISKVLDSFKEKIYVPESIFLIINNDLTLFLREKLQKQDFKVLLIENKKIKSAIQIDDIMFRLSLMFLDKLYKI